jgi:hypothetical protein
LDQYCFPPGAPCAASIDGACAERAAIVQADYDKSIDQDQRAVKM